MARIRRLAPRACALCSRLNELLYRVSFEEDSSWVLVCPQCWPQVSTENPHYRYGGTWNARKRS